jgi:hypothetical protein
MPRAPKQASQQLIQPSLPQGGLTITKPKKQPQSQPIQQGTTTLKKTKQHKVLIPGWIEPVQEQPVEKLVKEVKEKKVVKKITTKDTKLPKDEKPAYDGEPRNLLISKSGKKVRYFDLDSEKFVKDVREDEKEKSEARQKQMEEEKKQERLKELNDELDECNDLCKWGSADDMVFVEIYESGKQGAKLKHVFDILNKIEEYSEINKLSKIDIKLIKRD